MLTPRQVRRVMPAILAQLGTPAMEPKPRGKSPGWRKGTPRTPAPRFAVIKKPKRRRHICTTLSAKKCFPRRSSIERRGIPGFKLPLDVADKRQTGDVAPGQATVHFSHSRSV